jgi:hypothetical protein
MKKPRTHTQPGQVVALLPPLTPASATAAAEYPQLLVTLAVTAVTPAKGKAAAYLTLASAAKAGACAKSPAPLLKLLQSRTYRCTDRLHLIGGLDGFMAFNEWPPLSVRSDQFVVWLALVCHSLKQAGQEVPLEVGRTRFLARKQVLGTIENYLQRLTPPPRILSDADHLGRVVYQMRGRLEGWGLDPCLIESGPGGRGWRLSVPPRNVRLTFVDPATNKERTIAGA